MELLNLGRDDLQAQSSQSLEQYCLSSSSDGPAMLLAISEALRMSDDPDLLLPLLEVYAVIAGISWECNSWLLRSDQSACPFVHCTLRFVAKATDGRSGLRGCEGSTADDVLLQLGRTASALCTTSQGHQAIRSCRRGTESLLKATAMAVHMFLGYVQCEDERNIDSPAQQEVELQERWEAVSLWIDMLLSHLTSEGAHPVGSLEAQSSKAAFQAIHRLWHAANQISSGAEEPAKDVVGLKRKDPPARLFLRKVPLSEAERHSIASCVMVLAMEMQYRRVFDIPLPLAEPPADSNRKATKAGILLLEEILRGCSATHFFQDHWETKPLYVQGIGSDRFSWLGLSHCEETMRSLCGGLTCPEVCSTEADPKEWLRQQATVSGAFSTHPVFGDGVLAVKDGHPMTREQEAAMGTTDSWNTCARASQAFRKGFTIAIRGLMQRNAALFATTQCLGEAMGQSVGANAYYTPPGSRGLPPHFDDHCVIVLQVSGNKQWKLAPPEEAHVLPRLYSPRPSISTLSPEADPRVEEVLMLPGDAMYIPRGWAHEAQAGADGEAGRASLHVSLGLEVEPIFEWSGALHIVLRQLAMGIARGTSNPKSHSPQSFALTSSSTWLRDQGMSEAILHSHIETHASSSPSLRAACPAGAVSEVADLLLKNGSGPQKLKEHIARVFGGSGASFTSSATVFREASSSSDDAWWSAWMPLVAMPSGELCQPTHNGAYKEVSRQDLRAILDTSACQNIKRSHKRIREAALSSEPEDLWKNVCVEMHRIGGALRETRASIHAGSLSLSLKDLNLKQR